MRAIYIRRFSFKLHPTSITFHITLGKVCENSRAGENALMCLGFSLICSRILPSARLSFHQAMKGRRTCFISSLQKLTINNLLPSFTQSKLLTQFFYPYSYEHRTPHWDHKKKKKSCFITFDMNLALD